MLEGKSMSTVRPVRPATRQFTLRRSFWGPFYFLFLYRLPWEVGRRKKEKDWKQIAVSTVVRDIFVPIFSFLSSEDYDHSVTWLWPVTDGGLKKNTLILFTDEHVR